MRSSHGVVIDIKYLISYELYIKLATKCNKVKCLNEYKGLFEGDDSTSDFRKMNYGIINFVNFHFSKIDFHILTWFETF